MDTMQLETPVNSHVIPPPDLQAPVLDDPFDGYFQSPDACAIPKGGLLDIPKARRWLKTVGWGARNNFYTFQQPLTSKSGPYVHLKGRQFSMMSSLDYLGLNGHPAINAAAVEAIHTHSTGTDGSRLLTGTTELHRQFEKELSVFKGTEAAMTFSSGSDANKGAISALVDHHDRVILDSLAHRSIIDACKLAGVPIRTFAHNDPDSLEQALEEKPFGRRTLIIIEGIYSMDGDICALPEIVALKNKYDAFLMVDEAHSFGVLGATGRGVDEYFGVSPSDVDIWMGSLSKAIPSSGGFIAGRQDLIIYLQHEATPFIYSAPLNPASIAAARESLHIIHREPQRLQKLQNNAEDLRAGLGELGYNTGASVTPIVPVIVGENETAYQLARQLFDLGILVSAVVFPAVPRGMARLRLCATAAQSTEMLQQVLDAFYKLRQNGFAKPHQI